MCCKSGRTRSISCYVSHFKRCDSAHENILAYCPQLPGGPVVSGKLRGFRCFLMSDPEPMQEHDHLVVIQDWQGTVGVLAEVYDFEYPQPSLPTVGKAYIYRAIRYICDTDMHSIDRSLRHFAFA